MYSRAPVYPVSLWEANVCLAVTTCHLQFWQNAQDLLPATLVLLQLPKGLEQEWKIPNKIKRAHQVDL